MNPDQFRDLVVSTRSIRRFNSEKPVSIDILRQMVDMARQTSSWRNKQPLKFILVNGEKSRSKVFSCLNWAKALKNWGGPTEGEQPAGYVIILGDTSISDKYSIDPGIVSQTLMLAAKSFDLGGCIMASVDRDLLRQKLNISEHFEILLVVAVGEQAEDVQLEIREAGDERPYWRDESDVHHVPKRSLAEVTISEFSD